MKGICLIRRGFPQIHANKRGEINERRKHASMVGRRIEGWGTGVGGCWRCRAPFYMRRTSRVLRRSKGSSSGKQPSSDEYELEKLEIQEPAIEQGAEQAALSVIAATIFGAILWGVLGSTKGEGMCLCIFNVEPWISLLFLRRIICQYMHMTLECVFCRVFCWVFT